MENLDSKYSPNETEDKWYKFWEENSFFKADPNSNKKPFSLVIPPPNVTGVLHMGHALVNTLQDILIRYKKMSGFETLWVPGTDHAGISTQSVVEKHLIATLKKRRRDFTRDEFLSHIWKWKDEKEHIIINQLKKLGCSLDWSRARFTMDEKNNKAVKTVFKKMFDDGLIYRGDYLVNWDPITQTALSDDEVETEEVDSFLWHFKYPLSDKSGFITIATTRPETMLGDTAVAISKEDERYFSYADKKVMLPLMNREIPIIVDDFVDPEFGTGAVKITPAHSFVDSEVGERHKLDIINIMSPDGRINENGGKYFGLSMQKARQKIVEDMKELGLLVKIEPYKLKVGVSYRSKAKIEPYLSKQWFVKMQPFKSKLIDIVKKGKIKIFPKAFEKEYYYWIENLRDWCISRQLWWGHQIPVWYHKADPNLVVCSIEDTPKEIKGEEDNWVQDEDVLDTWFSSALWPFSALGWPEESLDLKKFFPLSILITGHDILFFWVARMIFMSEYIMKEVPFFETFINGLIYGKSYFKKEKDHFFYVSSEEKLKYDLGEKIPKGIFSKWEKMSKSKGNVIDPLEIIKEYGCDAMRIALTSSITQTKQIDLDRRKFDEFKNFANKIWNATRFITQNLKENIAKNLKALTSKDIENGLNLEKLTLEDKWILSKMNITIEKQIFYLENKIFDKASTVSYEFFWDDFCAYYLEISKPYLFGLMDHALRENKQKILSFILLITIRLMHPIAPFITEEVFSIIKSIFPDLNAKNLKNSLDLYSLDFIRALNEKAALVSPYPKKIEKENEKDIENFEKIKKLIYLIRNIRAEINVPLGSKTDLYISYKKESEIINLIKENEHILKILAKVDKIFYKTDEKDLINGATAILDNIKILVPLSQDMIVKEKKRLEKEKGKLLLQKLSLDKQLSNENFLSKAPSHIVDNLKNNLKDVDLKISEIDSKLKSY